MPKRKPYIYFARDLQVSVFPQYLIIDLWNVGYTEYRGMLAGIGMANREKVLEYFIKPAEWKRFQQFHQKCVEQDRSYMIKKASRAFQAVRRLNEFSERQIWKKDLSRLSNAKLTEIYKRFVELDTPCYAYGNVIFALEFGEGAYFSPRVRKILEKRAPARFKEYYGVLAGMPKKTVFYQQSLDLLEISYRVCKHKTLLRLFTRASPQEIVAELRKHHPRILREFQRQQRAYHWLFHSWEGPVMTVEDFILSAKDILKKGNVVAKLREKRHELEKLQKAQERIMRELHFVPYERWLLKMAQFAMWFQPYRKARQFKSCWHLGKYFTEVGKRLHISADQVRYLAHDEVVKALRSGKADADEINRRRKLFIYYYRGRKRTILSGSDAQHFIDDSIDVPKVKKLSTMHGMPAWHGVARGKVRIVNSLQQATHFAKGEILVSYATNPLLVPAMRQAGAILTEEGGMTCHAAIMARELNVPCVVGIHGIVEMFKDGDRVAVDAAKGIVKRIT
ncbi:MAG: Phosphoenolpyruvate synthase/pyruvate phosphate dikinase [Parcubacteria group bacterium GW2011_GWA2_48_9]|nr:MAG: Phosphoenolpyruvate synthase/pyruvate phosphate dikinase [Parcubacteria group bacterium GW2011_GWA2_48_9]